MIAIVYLQNRDCGPYTLAFAEYYTMNKLELMKPDFDIEAFRPRVACLLFHYATMKNQDCCQSDEEL